MATIGRANAATLALFGIVLVTSIILVAGLELPDVSCLCTLSANVIIRDSACGGVISAVGVNQCFADESDVDGRQSCTLDGVEHEFFRVDFNGQEGWISNEDFVNTFSTTRCSSQLKSIIIGDWGERLLPGQDQVAAGMATWAEENQPAWIMTTGDNIYPKGIFRWDDPQVDSKWRNVYYQESIRNLTWYISIGNHDMGDGGNEWNQIELALHEPRWVLPHLWYDFVERLGDHSIHFIVIDTESYGRQINGYEAMFDWFKETLEQSTADWKIVIGHRHVFSVGDVLYGPVTGGLLEDLVPVMLENNVDAYVCGHDHNLQHIVNLTDVDNMQYIITGAGGALLSRYIPENEEILRTVYNVAPVYFKRTYGFVTLTTSRDALQFDFYDQDARWLYSYTRNASQRKK